MAWESNREWSKPRRREDSELGLLPRNQVQVEHKLKAENGVEVPELNSDLTWEKMGRGKEPDVMGKT